MDKPKKQKNKKTFKPKARLVRGFRDIAGRELKRVTYIQSRLADLFESYGFDPLDTPSFEYSDALGKFLPDDDRPNEGVFALEDDDSQWVSLRYDLTAPLARYVSQNFESLPKPLRRYQTGMVFRNEKPGPGRFRQFLQFDADTVGASHPHADAEVCMLGAAAMEAIGIRRGDYVVQISNRKILDAVLHNIGLTPDAADYEPRRLTILRAMDKLDRLGIDGVRALLGEGRKDESGDFTKGAGLTGTQIDQIANFVSLETRTRKDMLAQMAPFVEGNAYGEEGMEALMQMDASFTALGFAADRILFDPSIVRGLGYYTGPIFEINLLHEIKDDAGNRMRFGAVGGGGRYDDLVKRFKGVEIPATGISIGVSRLVAALDFVEGGAHQDTAPLIVVLVMDKARRLDYVRLVQELRAAGLRAELYMGDGGMKAQLRYADARDARFALIEGEDEYARGEIVIKDLQLGAQQSEHIRDNREWRAGAGAQYTCPRADIVSLLMRLLADAKM